MLKGIFCYYLIIIDYSLGSKASALFDIWWMNRYSSSIEHLWNFLWCYLFNSIIVTLLEILLFHIQSLLVPSHVSRVILFCITGGWDHYVSISVPSVQILYHLRQLRKFRVSPAILKTFYSGAIESVLTQCISVWYSIATNQDCKALQRVVRLAERISGSALPSLQDIYLKRCKSRAAKIIKDSNHPGNHLFFLLPSGKRFRSMMAKTERFRRSFFPQAIRLLNSNSVW